MRRRAWPLLFVLGASCAGRPAPWDVPRGSEERFRETKRVCRLLTDEKDGRAHPERFEACMKRRGWERQNLFQRLWR